MAIYTFSMDMRSFGKRLRNFFLDVLFPPLCVNCRVSLPSQKEFLCDSCASHIIINDGYYCPICQARIPQKNGVCHRSPYILAAASQFQEPLPALIHTLKYNRIPHIAHTLAAIVLIYLSRIDFHIDDYIISPIPLHPKKQRERGFNQSEIIASLLASYYNTSFQDVLIRARHTPSQTFLSRKARTKNVEGCFLVINAENVRGRNIILVDDVSTSGATLHQAALVLKQNGAKHVIGVVVAKA